jgi:hypothetical protein
VIEARERWYVTWQSIAAIMEKDCMKGLRGDPPTANAVRRVWDRVRLEIADREAKSRQRKGVQ